MELTVPEKMQPDTPEDGITVPVEAQPYKSKYKDLSAACKSVGLSFISAPMLRKVRKGGTALDSIGIAQMSKSGMFMSQQTLLHVIAELTKSMAKLDKKTGEENVESRRQIAHTIGYLSGKFTMAHKEVMSNAKLDRPPPPEKKATYISFQPGSVVVQSEEVKREKKVKPNVVDVG